MRILINSKEQFVEEGISLAALLAQIQPQGKGMAVALNNKVVPRTDWEKVRLHENDSILIISAVCGG